MAEGEYEATKAWQDIVPSNVAEPIGWGELTNRPGKHFLLVRFRDMSDEMLSISDFVSIVASGHQKSASPTGRFGFHVTTYTGDHPYDNRWCDTWEEWFTRSMKGSMEREIETHGTHEELQQLSEQILTKVIPLLLRPTETGGRRPRPALVHGNLWHGNVGTDNETDEIALYDCGSFCGHNECMSDTPARWALY